MRLPAARAKMSGMRALADITKTPAFRRWFGKSKVVDASGRPLVVYHATPADFSVFRLPEQQGAQRFGPGFYFTRDLDTLEVYTGFGGSVMPMYLRIEHPQTNAALTAEQVDAFFGKIRTHVWPNGYDSKDDQARIYQWCMEDLANAFDRLVSSSEHFDQAEVLEGFKAAGIDGVIRPVFGHLEYVVFSPSQIKSATGNRGTFDAADPDIRHNPRRPRRNDSERGARVPVTETAAFRKWFGDSKVVDRRGQPLVVYHGTDHGGFFEFDFNEVGEGQWGFYFTDSRQMAFTYTGAGRRGADPTPPYHETVEGAVLSGLSGDELFTIETEGSEEDGDLVYSLFDEGSHVGYYRANRPQDMAKLLKDVNALSYTDQKGVYEVYLRIENPLIVDAQGMPWDSVPLPSEDEDGNEVVEHWTTREIARMAMDMGLDGAIIRNVYDGGGHSQGHESGDVFIVFDANQIKSSAANRGTFSRDENDIRKNPLRRFR